MVDRAREICTPCFRLEVEGIDRTRSVWEHLESLEYRDAESNESDSLSFTVANDPPFAIPAPGAKVRLWLGWMEAGLRYFGTFVVDECAIELSPAKMRVTAKSANFSCAASEKQRRDREWENVTLADIAAKIAAEHGCGSRVELDVHYPHIAQTGESNLSFLRRLASEVGASFSVKDETIRICPPDRGSRATATILCEESVSGSFSVKARSAYGEVEAKWWDREEGKEKKVSSPSRVKRESTGSGAAKHTMKKRYHSASEAMTAAENAMTLLTRGEFTGDITLPGDPNLVSGTEAALEGFKPAALNRRYLAKTVAHSVSKSGWTTQVELESLD